jgi:hypothetical protein
MTFKNKCFLFLFGVSFVHQAGHIFCTHQYGPRVKIFSRSVHAGAPEHIFFLPGPEAPLISPGGSLFCLDEGTFMALNFSVMPGIRIEDLQNRSSLC